MTTELDPARDSAWTPDELGEISAALGLAADRLRGEINAVDPQVSRGAGESLVDVLHDDLDVASHRAELLEDAVRAENAAAILAQVEHVLGRLALGLYGTCENCTEPIGRPRLEAFPRATRCMTCVA